MKISGFRLATSCPHHLTLPILCNSVSFAYICCCSQPWFVDSKHNRNSNVCWSILTFCWRPGKDDTSLSNLYYAEYYFKNSSLKSQMIIDGNKTGGQHNWGCTVNDCISIRDQREYLFTQQWSVVLQITLVTKKQKNYFFPPLCKYFQPSCKLMSAWYIKEVVVSYNWLQLCCWEVPKQREAKKKNLMSSGILSQVEQSLCDLLWAQKHPCKHMFPSGGFDGVTIFAAKWEKRWLFSICSN